MESVNVDSAPQPGPASNKADYYDARSQRLELSEMPEGLAAALAVFDLDNDGFVDADELGRGALAFSKAKVKVCGTQPRSRARVTPRWEAARDGEAVLVKSSSLYSAWCSATSAHPATAGQPRCSAALSRESSCNATAG